MLYLVLCLCDMSESKDEESLSQDLYIKMISTHLINDSACMCVLIRRALTRAMCCTGGCLVHGQGLCPAYTHTHTHTHVCWQVDASCIVSLTDAQGTPTSHARLSTDVVFDTQVSKTLWSSLCAVCRAPSGWQGVCCRV